MRASRDVYVIHADESVVYGASPIPQHFVRCSHLVTDRDLLVVVTLEIWIIDKEAVAISAIAIDRDEMAYEIPGQRQVVSSTEVTVANGYDYRLILVDVIPDRLELLRRGEVNGMANRRRYPVGFQQVSDILDK